MAKAQFQGSARASGFRPVSMQNSAPQRILQEANRVANGMRTQQQAIIEDRNNYQRDLTENFNIESNQMTRDYQIREKNIAAKYNAKGANAQAKAADQAAMYQGLSQFSAGAASFASQFVKSQQEAQVQTDINEFMVNPTYRENLLAAHDSMVLEGSAALTEANASVVATEMAGGSRPVQTGRVLDGFNQFSAGQKAAIFGYKADQFGSYMNTQMSGDRQFFDPVNGRSFTGAEAQADGRLYNIAANDVMSSFMRDNGFYQMSPEFTARGLDSIRKSITKGLARAEKNEMELQKGNTILNARQNLLYSQNPTEAVGNLMAAKSALLRANDYDPTKTTKSVLEMVYSRDARGEYLMNAQVREAVLNAGGWGPNGESLGSYKLLNADFQRQSRKDRISAHNDDHRVAKIESEEFWDQHRGDFEDILDEGNAMTDMQSFNTFEDKFYERFPELGENDLPDSYKRIKKEIFNENKEQEAELLTQAQSGFVDLTVDQARSFVDPNVRKAALELVRADMEKQYGGNYEDLQKSLKGFAKQLTGGDVSSTGMSPMGQVILPKLNEDFKKYYDQELGLLSSGGALELTSADYANAQQKAIQRLQQDVTEGLLLKEGARYTRKGDVKNNLYEFPNLNLGTTSAIERQKYGNTIKSFGALGDKAFDAPSLILETKDLQRITDTYTRTGMLDVPPVVTKLSQISGELPIEIINRQIEARGDDKFEIIKPPDAYYNMKGQNPEVVSLFHSARTPTQRYRALSQVPEFSNKGGSDDFSYFANSVAGVESASYGGYNAFNTGGAAGGTVAYGSGDSTKDLRYGKPITQLTVGEIRRLQASGQLHAAGRYQFVGVTFNEVANSMGLPDNTVFSPEVQDQFMIQRLRQRASFGQPLEEALVNEWVGLRRIRDDNPAEYARIVDTARRLLGSPSGSSAKRQRVYTTGNIGPTSTGQHLDVKQVGGGRFDLVELDDYIEVDDRDHGTVSLSSLRGLTNNVGDSFDEHVARGSHGIDVGTYEGTEVYLKNGARHVSNYETEHGTLTTIELPDGRQFTFLHGKG